MEALYLWLFVVGQSILVFQVKTLSQKVHCGHWTAGSPEGGKFEINNEGSFVYKCFNGSILIGNSTRKCTKGQITGSVPLCMPFLTDADFINLNGTGIELMDAHGDFVCRKIPFNIVFNKMFLSKLFVRTNGSCGELSIEADHTEHKQNVSHLSDQNSVLHTFEVNSQVTHLKIATKCCLYGVIFANSRVSSRCGTPDLPENVKIDQLKDKLLFKCATNLKLEGLSSTHCIGLEKWSHSSYKGQPIKCTPKVSIVVVVSFCVLALVLLISMSFFVCIWFTSKSEVEFEPKTLAKQLTESFKGLKVASKDITLQKPIEKVGFCTCYQARFKGKEVLAHICDLDEASSSQIPAVEQVRCLYSAVQFNFRNKHLLSVLALSNDLKNNPVLVYDKFPNGSLDAYLRSKKNLPTKKLIQMCIDVADGMSFLAQNRVVHRDLRAKNCFVDGSERVKVGNFKLSQELGNYDQFLSKNTVNRDHLPWAAPETVAESMASVEGDVWSFGVLMWEVFSEGKVPYESLSDLQITTHLLEEQRLSKPANCPEKLYELMLRCWKTDQEQRPTFADLGRSLRVLSQA